MDKGGIDLQVLSHTVPSSEILEPGENIYTVCKHNTEDHAAAKVRTSQVAS